jgi:predicted aspartyl protease
MLGSRAQHLSAVLIGLLTSALIFGCSGSSSTQSKQVSEHVRILRGAQGSVTVLMPVTINGQGPFTFALDTGAATSLVDTAVAAQAGLSTTGTVQTISGVGGVEQAVPVRIQSWSSGPITLPAITASAAQLPTTRRGGGLQGLVGSDVWNTIGGFTLDYRTGTLTVNAGGPSSPPANPSST